MTETNDAHATERTLTRREAVHQKNMANKGANYVRAALGLTAVAVGVSVAVEFAWSLFAGAAVLGGVGLWLRFKHGSKLLDSE